MTSDCFPDLLNADPVARREIARKLYRDIADYDKPSVLKIMKSALQDNDAEVRVWACLTLAREGQFAESVLPILEELIVNGNPWCRTQSVIALGLLGSKGNANEVLPQLMRLTSDEKIAVRKEAIIALGRCGASAHMAVPLLIEIVNTERDGNELFAVEALGAIGPKAERAVPILIAVVQDGWYSNLRAKGAEALGRLGKVAHAAVPTLCDAAADSNRTICLHAIIALGAIASEPKRSLPCLATALSHHWSLVRYQALKSIQSFSVVDHTLIMSVALRLKDPDKEVRVEAAKTLGCFGKDARESLPLLQEAIDSGSQDFVQAARNAISKVRAK